MEDRTWLEEGGDVCHNNSFFSFKTKRIFRTFDARVNSFVGNVVRRTLLGIHERSSENNIGHYH